LETPPQRVTHTSASSSRQRQTYRPQQGNCARRLLTISQAAARIGVHPNTLRAWVDKGLVPATRLPSGYRRFSAEQVEQIKRQMAQGKAAA
jgi:excisionase family DNA binding protein